MTRIDFQGSGENIRRMETRKAEKEASGLIYRCCMSYPSNCIHLRGSTIQLGEKNDNLFPGDINNGMMGLRKG